MLLRLKDNCLRDCVFLKELNTYKDYYENIMANNVDGNSAFVITLIACFCTEKAFGVREESLFIGLCI